VTISHGSSYQNDRGVNLFADGRMIGVSIIKKPWPSETRRKLVEERNNPNKINGFVRVASDERRCDEIAQSGFLSPECLDGSKQPVQEGTFANGPERKILSHPGALMFRLRAKPMKLIGFLSRVAGCVFALLGSLHAAAATDRERSFNDNWTFLRGDAPGAEQSQFDGSSWRHIDLPHDWSIEDLPPRQSDPLFATVPLVPGDWRFSPGDDQARSAPAFDDSSWQSVSLPELWNKIGQTANSRGIGWFRRHFIVPASPAGKTVFIDLGVIDGHDWIYVDGEKLEESSDDYWSNGSVMARVVELPPEHATPGDHVVAVKIDCPPTGGFTAAVLPPASPSPLDPGRSAGNISTGYSVGGVGWYRKDFVLPASDAGKLVRVIFDGSYMQTTVWLNGAEIGSNQYGYSPFGFDLTQNLKPVGEHNVLAVKVANLGKNSRWYSGSGLFRPVHLEITNPLRIAQWGVSVTTPEIHPDNAIVKVNIELLNSGPAADATVRVRIRDPRGKIVASSQTHRAVSSDGMTANLSLDVPKPKLWSPDSPLLYRAEVTVLSGNQSIDSTETSFGIRSLSWDAEHGFQLNGQTIKLRGGCIHHDHGELGSASFPAAEERRVAILKAAGFNSIRCSHNMPAASFLEACDRAGMLVVDEAFDMWNQAKNPQDYSLFFKDNWQRDINAMLQRDRNHPCVVMWSIGNEIPERFEPSGAATAHMLADHIRSIDSTRPITAAFNKISNDSDPFFAALDICGYNYAPKSLERDHARLKNRIMMTTESYPKDAFEYWDKVTRIPSVIGDFVWTAWDYRGESAIGHTFPAGQSSSYLLGWPFENAFCGDFDVCGFVKPQSLYRQVLWGIRPAAILVEDLPPGRHTVPDYWGWRDEEPSWTWPGSEGQPRVVRVYANGDLARLLLNGKEIQTQPIDDQLTATFTVPYSPGKLKAEVLKNGAVIGQDQLATAGAPAAIRLTVENPSIEASRQSIAFIDVEAVDKNGRLMPLAENRIRVSLEGNGTLAGFGNGDPQNIDSVQQQTQKLWRGRALLVVRSTGVPGRMKVRADADDLHSAHAIVKIH
jgi:beta-galactosidase